MCIELTFRRLMKFCANPDPRPGFPGHFSAHRLKFLGAILLLLGLLLPLYSCSGRFTDASGREVKYVDRSGTIIPEKDIDLHQPLPSSVIRMDANTPLPPGVTYHKNYHFFFGGFSYDNIFDWFRLAGFLWPLSAAIFAARLKHRWSRRLFPALEPVLVLESSLALSTSAIFGAKEIGFWAAWTGIILYSLGAARSDMTALRKWKPGLSQAWKIVDGILLHGLFLGCSVISVLVFFEWFVN
jgi:hypothetical protein